METIRASMNTLNSICNKPQSKLLLAVGLFFIYFLYIISIISRKYSSNLFELF